MLRTILSRLSWPLLGGAAALLITTTTALAGSGVGATMNLGETNTVDAQTTLTGNPGANVLFRFVGSGTAATLRTDAGTGTAITGISNSGTGQLGQSVTGAGLQGVHSGTTGTKGGVEGRTAATDDGAVGVLGTLTASAPGAGSAGVSGINPSSGANGFGVSGFHQGSGIGVFGQSVSGTGMKAVGATTGLLAQLTGFPTTADSAIEALVRDHGRGLHVHSGGVIAGDSVGIQVDDVIPALRARAGSPSVSRAAGIVEATNDSASGRGVVGTADNGVGVLGRSTNGLAGRFEGNVHVTGTLTRAYTSGTANKAAPIAYGVVNSSGTLVSGTPNVSASFDSVNKRYLITIAGETYTNTGYATVITPSAAATVPLFPTASSLSGQLLVRVWNLSGSPVPSAFSFVTFKP